MSRKKKRKIAFWVSEDRITEEQKRKILSIIEEDVEFIEYNFPVSITDAIYLKGCIQQFDFTISTHSKDVNIFLWDYVDMAEKIFIVRRINTYGEEEFIRITDFKDICQYTET